MLHLLTIQLLLSIVVASHAPLSESSSLGSPRSMVGSCHDDERKALLTFKATTITGKVAVLYEEDNAGFAISDFIDPYHIYPCRRPYAKTHSWKNNESSDCCQWDGVTCDPSSGHVTKLDLSCSLLTGRLPSNNTLSRLRHLRHLNLAFNNFSFSLIPSDIGRLSDLTYLNLSLSGFQGQVPKEIGWLSRLTTLDLSYNEFLTMPNFKTVIANLTNLRELDLSLVIINSTIPPILANLSNQLQSLLLTNCDLQGHFLVTSILGMPNLRFLHIGDNPFSQATFSTSKVLQWRSPLESVDFSGCDFTGQLPDSIGESASNFSLRSIDISDCGFYGSVPIWIWKVAENVFAGNNNLSGSLPVAMVNTELSMIDFSHNKITGEIPSWMFALPSLKYLNLEHNELKGTIQLSKLHNLHSLNFLRLSLNKLSIMDDLGANSTSFWPRLSDLGLSSCNLGHFPSFLRRQHNLTILDLSNNGIRGLVPGWFLNTSTNSLRYLVLSNNLLTGGLDHLQWNQMHTLDISYNMLEGNLPIPPKIVNYFQASHNLFAGEIPSSFCYLPCILLDLSHNKLTGKIPHCFAQPISQSMFALDLRENQLEGVIPSVIFETELAAVGYKGCGLFTLSLSGNLLEGPIPHSLVNCKGMEVLDFNNNRLNDTFPQWLVGLPNLQVLTLGSNNLHGSLQMSSNMISTFPALRILDISNNVLIGELPCGLLMSFKAMIEVNTDSESLQLSDMSHSIYEDSINAQVKGLSLEFREIFDGLVLIDASNNRLEGHIPEAIGDLVLLKSLNLSHNNFTGSIPPSLGNLSQLESLDLSFNSLGGHIPSDLVNLTALGFFNVSENNLVGPVPTAKQFGTFLDNSYLGNPRVCGELLTKKCGTKDKPVEVIGLEYSSSYHEWEIILVGLGCGLFLGCAWGYFIFWKSNYYWVVRLIFSIEDFIMLNRRRLQKRRN